MPVPGSADRFESHIDRLIREAMERGEFDDLPGLGEPIPGGGTYDDELWWVRSWLKRNLSNEGDEPDGQGSSRSS